MTAAEACDLLVAQTRDLARARAERDSEA